MKLIASNTPSAPLRNKDADDALHTYHITKQLSPSPLQDRLGFTKEVVITLFQTPAVEACSDTPTWL